MSSREWYSTYRNFPKLGLVCLFVISEIVNLHLYARKPLLWDVNCYFPKRVPRTIRRGLDVDFRSISARFPIDLRPFHIRRFNFLFDCDSDWIRYIIRFDSVDFVFPIPSSYWMSVCLKPEPTHWWFLQQLDNLSRNSRWFFTIFMSGHKSSVPSPRLRGPPIIIILGCTVREQESMTITVSVYNKTLFNYSITTII
jgi:hypothetical protein